MHSQAADEPADQAAGHASQDAASQDAASQDAPLQHAAAPVDATTEPASTGALLAAVAEVRAHLDAAHQQLAALERRLARVRGKAGLMVEVVASRRASVRADVADAEWDLAEDRAVWSAEMFRIFGRDAALGPLTLDQLPAYLHEDDRPALSGALTAALVDGRRIDTWFRVARPDGTLCTVHCAGRPEQGTDGTVRSIRLEVQDVTESRLS
ncbi:PAS domain-containing protein [Streptacidiphilus sp. EB129]|uniref:PAS domain-containing protein n=1 Tax=Streptacidiphilus sp. EB129 TaxID=3156262 RepID=UPI0035132F3C